MSTTKNFDFTFPNRFEYDSDLLEFFVSGTSGGVRQFKTARGQNVLKSQIPVTDNPLIPAYLLPRLTDGNLSIPFRHKDVASFRFTLDDETDLNQIVVKHEVGTQPNDVVVAISQDGVTLEIIWSNDCDDSLGLGFQGTDSQFIATEDGLKVDLICKRAKYVHIFTAGFISHDVHDPSTNETRIVEIEAYECVYSTDKPVLLTSEKVRLTDFLSLDIISNEDDLGLLGWNPISNGDKYWFNSIEWIKVDADWQYNTTAEIVNNIVTLFRLPTVYDLSFSARFISENGATTAVLTKLAVTYENNVTNKATTTRVYGQIVSRDGLPRTDVYVTAVLDIGNNQGAVVEQEGSTGRIIFADEIVREPSESDKVNTQGVFYKDLVPNSIMSESRTKYIFTFWKKHPQNDKKFVPLYSVQDSIPQISRYNLATQTIAVQ